MEINFARAASARRLLRWQPPLNRPRSWVCSACRVNRLGVASQRFASQSSLPSEKPFYVTTPIFYVNAAPHIGHMYSMVLADVFKRWQTLMGKRALLSTGTDEHGIKVQQAAALDDKPPKEFCDQFAERFEELAQLSRIDYDRFIRTTDEDHIQAVEHFWFLLQEKGLIYETKHEGWYSVSDECFYPESQIVKSQEPFTGAVYMASAETGNKVEWVEEKNYRFRMTALKDRLLDFYEKNPGWVEPASRMNEVVNWVKNHLDDLSISRPVQRLSWGIQVPGDASQTIYVWVDALVNYLTSAGFPTWTPGQTERGGWPADIHVIGKDILRFHCVYWPALLIALDLPLPKRILTHAHWTLNRKKMSKSLGNVVNPTYAISRWGIDTVRFYLLFEGGIADDANYDNTTLAAKYKKHLQWGFGNLLGRVTRTRIWNLPEIIANAAEPQKIGVSLEKAVADFENQLLQLRPNVTQHMEQLNPVAAIRCIIEQGGQINDFLSSAQPWALLKSTDPENKAAADKVVYMAAESLRVCGILLQPFLPDKATQLLDTLGVAQDKRTYAYAVPNCDLSYGTPFIDPGRDRNDGLFPPLVEDKDVDYAGNLKAQRRAAQKRPEKKAPSILHTDN
ncbi:hypothetical protein N656DRAFT_727150 [Canariomyces notabilis]|uniref:Probable methionine--tRNA ligase, mitochondrial n=1 Tax=Canariomyces notabilis TaxID=2074819 RepID=A0AAN6YUH2_9PEZI|nr:hypothetical protein N656DRAFT_727150 [Canariomyces arenarius]